jgi:hypothetical protein
MKKNIFWVHVFILFQFVCVGQKTIKPSFTSLNQVGIAWGATDDALQLQTINGVSYKTYSAGIGIGLDYYWERTVPLFIDLRKNIFSKKANTVCLCRLGISIPWVKTDKENTWSKSDYDNGSYVDIGIGYKVPINKKLFANLSFGYSQKKLHEKRVNEMMIFDFRYGGNNAEEDYDYTFRRFSLKAGLSF